jgi:hypothetical protein
MKKTFKGKLFNRLETLGKQTFNHVGCEGNDEQFIDFLTQFVPELGDQRKVKFTIEALEEIKKVQKYKQPKDYINK